MMLAFVMGTIMLTMFSYLFPTISIPFMEWLPSYPIIFSYEEILFSGKGILFSGIFCLTLWSIVLYIVAYLCIKFWLLRPHKGE